MSSQTCYCLIGPIIIRITMYMKKYYSGSPSIVGNIPFVTPRGYPWSSGCSGCRILILQCWGYCGNGIHCTGSLATWNCLLEDWSFLWNLWESCSQLRVWRIGILFTLPWLDEVAVFSKALSSCWNLNHVGVGFSALLTYHSFLIIPRIRILEPYIPSCL